MADAKYPATLTIMKRVWTASVKYAAVIRQNAAMMENAKIVARILQEAIAKHSIMVVVATL